jgi:hypothetical protein
MKPTIIPDYIRYTYFTPTMRLMLAELAEKRNLYIIRFKLTKLQYEEALEGNASVRQVDQYYQQMQNHLEVISEIDQAIREIYFLHRRLN